MSDYKRVLLLSATALLVLVAAMAVTACSPETTASAADNEAARAIGGAPEAVALEAVEDLVAANDALRLRVEDLETRLEQSGEATRPASAARTPRYGAETPAAALALDADSRSGAFTEDRAVAERPTYDAPHRAPDREEVRPVVPAYSQVTVAEGTPIAIEIVDPISTRYSKPGDSFTARLSGDLLANDGHVALGDGAAVTGHVSEVRKDQRIGGRASLTVVLDTIELPDGSSAPLQAAWETQGKSQTKRDAATIGGATVGGAILGRILDQGDGDVIGGLIGAAAGSAIARQKLGQPIVLDPGAILRMTLRAPIEVTVRN